LKKVMCNKIINLDKNRLNIKNNKTEDIFLHFRN